MSGSVIHFFFYIYLLGSTWHGGETAGQMALPRHLRCSASAYGAKYEQDLNRPIADLANERWDVRIWP